MSSREKRAREQIDAIRKILLAHGIDQWHIEATRKNHSRLVFYRYGKPLTYTFHSSSERHATHNTIAGVRRVIRNADASGNSHTRQSVRSA